MNRKLLVIATALLLSSCGGESSCPTQSCPTPECTVRPSSTSSKEPTSSKSSQSVEPAEENKLVSLAIASPGVNSFYVGENFSAKGLKVIGTYEDGSTQTIPNEKLTFSGINLSKGGTYDVVVSYQGLSASYQATVYVVSDVMIRIGGFKDLTNTRGQDATQRESVSSVIFQNDEPDFSGIFITLFHHASPDSLPVPIFVPLDDPHVKITGFDRTAVGPQNPTIRFKMGELEAEESFPVNVTNALPYINRSGEGRFIECRVDPSFEGMAGTINNGTKQNSSTGKHHVFSSITEALDYLRRFSLDVDTIKRIYLADGTYEEKLDITLPHTEIYGNQEDGSKVIIAGHDGVKDGTAVTKDSESYVVAVREEANDCYFSSFQILHGAKDDHSLTETGVATALLIQADRFVSSYNTISGLDKALILPQDRAHFIHATVVGRKYMVDDSANGVVHFEDCDFIALDSGKEEREVLFDLPNSLNNASGAAKVGARFERCNFKASEGVRDDSYALFAIDSAYVSVEFKDTVDVWGHLGNTSETLFLPDAYNMGIDSVHVVSNTELHGVALPSLPEQLIDLFAIPNGRGHFVNDWDGQRNKPYNSDIRTYIEFDGFHHTCDGDQTVLAHDVNLAPSEEQVVINDLLTLSPNGGISYDSARHATFLGKGSSLKIKAPAGAVVTAQVILPEENRYFSTGIGVHAENGLQRINRPNYRLYCNGNVGDINEYSFEALEDSYIKNITITPNAFATSSYGSGKYEHNPYPNDFFIRNFRLYLNYYQNVYYKDFVSPARDGFTLQYENEGYCLTVDPCDGKYNSRVRVNLVRGGSYHYTSATQNDDHILHMVSFSTLYREVEWGHYMSASFYDTGRNAIEITYVRSKKTPDADERGKDYYDDSDWDCIPLHDYNILIDVPNTDFYESYRAECTCSYGHQSLSWASTWDNDIPDNTDLGVNGDTGLNQYAGLLNVYDGGRAYRNQENAGLTMVGNTRFRVKTGYLGNAKFKYVFKVGKGSKFEINKVGEDASVNLDTPLASSTPDYDILVYAGSDGTGFQAKKDVQFDINPLGEDPVTIISYDIVEMGE